MDKLQVLVDAILNLKDVTASKEEIKKSLPTLNAQLANDKSARVNIVAGLDIPKTKQLINAQLATIGKDIKINIGNINTGAIQSVAQQVQSAVGVINNSVTSISGNGVFSGSFTKTFANTSNALELAKQEFAQLNNVASVTGNWIKGMNNTLIGFTVNVKSTSGAVEDFRYRLEEIDKVKSFFYQGSKGSDSGILKMSQEIENAKVKYERLLADFKSSNSAIISGLSQPLSDVEAKLQTLGKGTGVNELANSFERLKTSASEISKYLDTTNSSFNKTTNAVNNYRDMDATLKKLSTSYNNLINKNADLDKQITSAKTSLAELQAIEKQSGTNADWAKKYQLVNAEIKSIETNLKLVQNAEKADKNSVAQQQLKYYGKISEEITTIHNLKKKLSNAGTDETAEIQRQITNAQKRISYAEQQIQKKHLYNEELLAEVNTLKKVYAEQDKINKARRQDKANTFTAKLANDITLETSNLAVLEQKWKNQGILTGEFKAKVDQLKTSLSQVSTADGFKQYENELKNITDQAKLAVAQNTNLGTNIKKLNSDMIAFARNNQKAMQSTKISSNGKTIAQDLADLQLQLKHCEDPTTYRRIATNFRNIQSEVKALGLQGNTVFGGLWDKVKKFSGWMGMTTFVSRAVREVKQLFKYVVEIDKAMVSLKKVTDATDAEFNHFLKNAIVTAKELGTTITDIIDSTAEFSRLGFNLPDATELGKLAILYKNVGDGISATDASQSIISTMKAFNIQADKAIEIIDKFNEVGNNYSISSAGIGEALQRSASALAEANNDLSQSIALQVGANNVIQNPEVVGNMWKTVAMRIRGATTELKEAGEDTDGMVESTAQLRDIVKGMTGFDIMLDENTFKSTYDIVVGIGEQFGKLKDIDQASLLEKLAGKRHGNALAAALNNIDDIKAAYKSAENSAGSAMKEQEEYMKGIQYSLDTLKASVQSLANTAISSDFVKGAVDFLTKIVDLLDTLTGKIGTLPTLIGGIGTAIAVSKGLKNTGGDKMISLRICPSYACGNTERVYAKMVA